MNANADLINAAASGELMQCPTCGCANHIDNNFCMKCGTPLTHKAPTNESVFAPASAVNLKKNNVNSSPFAPAEPETDTAVSVQTADVQNEVKTSKTKASDNAGHSVSTPFSSVNIVDEPEEEEVSALAQGLPAWNIEPPHSMVRRRRNK